MTDSMVKAVITFFSYAVMAIGAENVIFTRGLGLSSGLRMISDPKKDTLYFCASLTFFQLINSLLAFFLVPLIGNTPLAPFSRFVTPVLIVVCCAISYVVVVVILGAVLKASTFKKIVYSLTSASINSSILGTILLTLTQGFTLLQTIGFALGSSRGYFLAMLLITEGERKINHNQVPQNFQGLPVQLIYISILALAVYGLTGHSIAL